MAPSYREIERKFLVQQPPEAAGIEPRLIEQGYLVISTSSSEPVEVRLRRVNRQETLLTIKSKAAGSERVEVEIPIDKEQFEALWPLTEGRRLVKYRYPVSLPEGELSFRQLFRRQAERLIHVFMDNAQYEPFQLPC